jgi:molecular chaperone HtpG
VLKEGIGDDAANRERIAALLRFATTAPGGEEPTVALKDYVGRMKEGQDRIYYVTAESLEAARSSPHLEVFRKKGIEVLLLADRVDEWMLSFLNEFEGKALASVAKGGLDLGAVADENEKAEQQQLAEENRDLVAAVKAALGERVKDVRVTFRLTESAACLVSEEAEMSGHLQRLLKAAGQKAPTAQPILELNPQHPLVAQLRAMTDTERLADWSQLLLDQALLAEGGQLEQPAAFVARVNRLLLDARAA